MTKVLLFDIDGTLIHTRGAGRAALQAALASAFGIAEPTDQVPIEGRTDQGICRDLLQFHGIAETEENWERFRQSYLEHLPRTLAARPGVILPGISALLEQMQHREDVRVGLLTGNTRAGARIKLDHFQLSHYFRFGGFGDVHCERNDVARAALAATAAELGVAADLVRRDRIWVIGDTPNDIACARSIGAQAVGVATGQHTLAELGEASPDFLIADFLHADELLAQW